MVFPLCQKKNKKQHLMVFFIILWDSRSEIPKNVVIQEKDRGSIIAALPPRSIQTFIWWT